MMALGTLGLFVYAMAEPAGFAERMQGLGYVPEPLWWLLGAVVSFYFGARELHHFRGKPMLTLPVPSVPRSPVERGADHRLTGGEHQDPPRQHPPATLPASAETAPPLPDAAPRAQIVATALADAAASGRHAPASADDLQDPTFNAALEEWRARASYP